MQTQSYKIMNLPIAIIDARAPHKAIIKLQEEFTVLKFITKNICYDAIEGHPDVFICFHNNSYTYAPNTPQAIIDTIQRHTKNYTQGNTNIGKNLANTTPYNCVVTQTHIFHKEGYTDTKIIQQNQDKTYIPVPQAYTRCSMIS